MNDPYVQCNYFIYAYLKPCQTSKVDLFAIILCFTLDVWLSSECASEVLAWIEWELCNLHKKSRNFLLRIALVNSENAADLLTLTEVILKVKIKFLFSAESATKRISRVSENLFSVIVHESLETWKVGQRLSLFSRKKVL